MNISRRSFVQTAAIGSAGLALSSKTRSATSAPPRQPNLLFLMTDQHRADTLPHAGNKVIRAPHLDALASRSSVFRGAYCCQPVCTPSRGSIFTGLYPHNHGSIDCEINLRQGVRSIAEYLPSDYATGYFGKWHLGNELVAQHGFKEWISSEDLLHRAYVSLPETLKLRSSYHEYLLGCGFPPDEVDPIDGAKFFSYGMAASLAPQYTKSWFLCRQAERFLRQRRDGQPFMLTVSVTEPHPPTWGPWNDRYSPDEMPVGPAFCKPIGSDASIHHRRLAERFRKYGYDGHATDDVAGMRRVKANYYGLVEMVDDAFGRVIQALEDSGQADNTIIVYTSDHGEMMGDHAMMGKLMMYEESVRIPLMIHVPWLSNRQAMLNGPVSQVNLTPTLVDLMGQSGSENLDGRSFAGALRDPSSWQPENAVVEWNDWSNRRTDCRSVAFADGWKINFYRDEIPELFDLNTDPCEMHNVAREPSNRDRIRRMREWTVGWQERHHDTMSLGV